jgi:hypothetical protein
VALPRVAFAVVVNDGLVVDAPSYGRKVITGNGRHPLGVPQESVVALLRRKGARFWPLPPLDGQPITAREVEQFYLTQFGEAPLGAGQERK